MNNNRTTKPLEFNVECNPINSKALLGIVTKMSASEIVSMCMSEILSGVHLNTMDLPFYAAACDVIKSTLVQKFSDSDKELYNNIIKNTKTIVVDAEEMHNQMKQHQQSNSHPESNLGSTVSQDASQDDTETYEGHPVNPDEFIEALLGGIVDSMLDDAKDKEEGDNDE